MRIGDFEIGGRTMVIAEIGNNHEGDFHVARMLVERAAECGVDAVKFQTIRAEQFVASDQVARRNQIKGFELSDSQFRELAALTADKGLLFLSTPFSFETADMLEALVPAYKISSGDLTWHQFLDHVARKDKPILLSTGMSTVEEIELALEAIQQASRVPIREKVVLLHCVSSYPVDIGQASLLTIPYLAEKFGLSVGYSDHCIGIGACQTAVALGACVIEKHFTYRKEGQSFRDHALSADPADMKELVASLRHIEASLGSRGKSVMESEEPNRMAMRRSLAAVKQLHKGDTITEEAVTFLRPGTGIAPEMLSSIVGRRVARDIDEGNIILGEDLE